MRYLYVAQGLSGTCLDGHNPHTPSSSHQPHFDKHAMVTAMVKAGAAGEVLPR